MDQRTLLAFGNLAREDRANLLLAAAESAFSPELIETVDEALSFLRERTPHAVVVATESEGARDLVLHTRTRPEHARVPVVGIAPAVNDLSFAEAFAWGGDDLVGGRDPRKLSSRLRALPRLAPQRPSNGGGKALIADPDPSRRVLVARVLRNAGYTVTFAATARDAWEFARDPGLDLIVTSDDLDDSPRDWIARSRSAGSTAAWVHTAAPRRVGALRVALDDLQRVAVTDAYAPAENVVFLANEQRRGGASNQRSSARLLYGTTVAFRGAGRDVDDHGFSYNVSLGGAYVRTLAPPVDDLVWIELTPPRSDRRVRLVGQVVWRREFGPNETATVPPGFGVQIVDGAAADLGAWRQSYQAFAKVVS